MRIVVEYQGDGLEFELSEERLVASWCGPKGMDPSKNQLAFSSALENPRDFPPIRHLVVPGDKVVIAMDSMLPCADMVVKELGRVFGESGVMPEDLTFITTAVAPRIADSIPKGESLIKVHDPDDRSGLAYLATTEKGHRVYLSRVLTDADVVVPVGEVRHDRAFGYRGPWSVVFPCMSDRETLRDARKGNVGSPGEASRPPERSVLNEFFEVNWLLGTQFHIGILPGADGLLEVFAGREVTVRDRSIESLNRLWTFQAPARAEVVVGGVGCPGRLSTIEDLADAFATAMKLVQHGGKIILLSRASGPIGPSLRRLMDAEDPRRSAELLRGHEASEDYVVARKLADALAWADLFLYSALEPQDVEQLSIVPLDRAEQSRRLVANSSSATLVSHVDFTFASVADEDA